MRPNAPLLLLSCALCALPLASCAKPKPPSVEEQILKGMFADFVLAAQYDTVCNGGHLQKAGDTDEKKQHYYGNAQVLGAKLAMAWKAHRPEDKPDAAVAAMRKIEGEFGPKLANELKEKGCEGEVAQAGAVAYRFYTETHPGTLMAKIDQSILDAGGTVTGLDDAATALDKATGTPPAPEKTGK